MFKRIESSWTFPLVVHEMCTWVYTHNTYMTIPSDVTRFPQQLQKQNKRQDTAPHASSVGCTGYFSVNIVTKQLKVINFTHHFMSSKTFQNKFLNLCSHINLAWITFRIQIMFVLLDFLGKALTSIQARISRISWLFHFWSCLSLELLPLKPVHIFWHKNPAHPVMKERHKEWI